jgi:hypothetical protein
VPVARLTAARNVGAAVYIDDDGQLLACAGRQVEVDGHLRAVEGGHMNRRDLGGREPIQRWLRLGPERSGSTGPHVDRPHVASFERAQREYQSPVGGEATLSCRAAVCSTRVVNAVA